MLFQAVEQNILIRDLDAEYCLVNNKHLHKWVCYIVSLDTREMLHFLDVTNSNVRYAYKRFRVLYSRMASMHMSGCAISLSFIFQTHFRFFVDTTILGQAY